MTRRRSFNRVSCQSSSNVSISIQLHSTGQLIWVIGSVFSFWLFFGVICCRFISLLSVTLMKPIWAYVIVGLSIVRRLSSVTSSPNIFLSILGQKFTDGRHSIWHSLKASGWLKPFHFTHSIHWSSETETWYANSTITTHCIGWHTAFWSDIQYCRPPKLMTD